jgi:hypothetical protein
MFVVEQGERWEIKTEFIHHAKNFMLIGQVSWYKNQNGWIQNKFKTADCELKWNVFSNYYHSHQYKTYQLFSSWGATTNTKNWNPKKRYNKFLKEWKLWTSVSYEVSILITHLKSLYGLFKNILHSVAIWKHLPWKNMPPYGPLE